MWLGYEGAVCQGQRGDHIGIPFKSKPLFPVESAEHWGWPVHAEVNGSSRITGHRVCGTIGSIGCAVSAIAESTTFPAGLSGWSDDERSVYMQLRRSNRRRVGLRAANGGPSSSTGENNREATQTTFLNDGSLTDIYVLPGDVCVFIRSDNKIPRPGLICVFIDSFIRAGKGQARERVVRVRPPQGRDGGTGLDMVSVANVTSLPEWRYGSRTKPVRFSCDVAAPRGVLRNGELYVVYSVTLYADGSKQHKSLSDTRSVGGCYMLPLGLSIGNRRSSAAARVLTVTGNGQDPNDALNILIDDIVNASTNGIIGTDPYGRTVRISIDPLTFFADYPAAAAATDVMSHSADTFYTHCVFQRRKKTSNPEILYSTEIHSRRLGFMRFEDRLVAVREASPHPTLIKSLGFKCGTKAAACELPMVNLCNKLRESDHGFKTSDGKEVPRPIFDSFLNAAAAPDHCLTGLAADVIFLCFRVLSSNEQRREYELRIVHCASSNGLPIIGKILRFDKGTGLFKGLVSLTMTAKFCVLMAAAPIFKQLYFSCGNDVFLLPDKLQGLVLLVYRWPSASVDGAANAPPNESQEELRREGELYQAACSYIKHAAAVYVAHGDDAKVLDKPNAHRAIELCVHTIPNFDNGRNCSEMVLELMHQCFKDWLESNTHADSHITAVERALTRDWLGRMYGLYMLWKHGSDMEKECGERGLLRMVLGEEGLKLDKTGSASSNFLGAFHEALEKTFREPILSVMAACGHVIAPGSRNHEWDVCLADKRARRTSSHEAGLCLLVQHYKEMNMHGEEDLLIFMKARFVSVDKFTKNRVTYPHHVVEEGCAVSAVVNKDAVDWEVVETVDAGQGVVCFYAVFGIASSKSAARGAGGPVWAFVKQLLPVQDGMSCAGSSLKPLELECCVRWVALIEMNEFI